MWRALQDVGKVIMIVVSCDPDDGEAMRKSAKVFVIESPIYPTVKRNRGIIAKLRWALDPNYLNLHGSVASLEDPQPNRFVF